MRLSVGAAGDNFTRARAGAGETARVGELPWTVEAVLELWDLMRYLSTSVKVQHKSVTHVRLLQKTREPLIIYIC